MPASIWPIAILLPMMIVLSSELPHEPRAVVMPGVVGASPDESVASRARFQSNTCLMTARLGDVAELQAMQTEALDQRAHDLDRHAEIADVGIRGVAAAERNADAADDADSS